MSDEPTWDEHHVKRLTLELESDTLIEAVTLGSADRPSEVVRLLRAAADDFESKIRKAPADSS